jgi:benzoyl-CoA-dihydrodiol lyase
VNFCKFTNETRLALEDANRVSGLRTIAALNGIASGGGYELALACEHIILRDDGNSAVAFPETPLLGVLPGTGGLTRLVDKRKVRRDLADVFSTVAEGVKGRRAKEWNLVDEVVPASKFTEVVAERAREFAEESAAVNTKRQGPGVTLFPIEPAVTKRGASYRHLTVELDHDTRVGTITIRAPEADMATGIEEIHGAGGNWAPLAIFRELDHALIQLRFSHQDVGLLLIQTEGDPENVLRMDQTLREYRNDWFVTETRHFIKRTLKRLDMMARSLFALVTPGSCFAGTFLELALACDRSYMLDDPDEPVSIELSPLNASTYPMANGISRLESRYLADPDALTMVFAEGGPIEPTKAAELGLVTFAFDDLDWEDDVRVAIEERASFSPDSLTGMEANLRFAGPETVETKIFGRLSAWQNWIFQRPNAVGKRGALTMYGEPRRPEFDWRRT